MSGTSKRPTRESAAREADRGVRAEPGSLSGVRPLMVSQKDLPKLLSVSDRHISKLQSSGRFPRPVRLGSRKLWSVAVLERWVEEGCPAPREE